MSLTTEKLAEYKALAERATKGPWYPFGTGVGTADATGPLIHVAEACVHDAAFIAAARTAVPALIAAHEAAQARIAELEEVLQRALHYMDSDGTVTSVYQIRIDARALLKSSLSSTGSEQ